MADAVVAQPPAINGTAAVPVTAAGPADPRPESPSSSISSMKRKRELSNGDSVEPPADDDGSKPDVQATQAKRNEKELIRDYFQVLKSFDTTPSIFQRPITEPSLSDEPLPKRQKSDDGAQAPTIEDKVVKDTYKSLEDLVKDVKQAVDAQIAELKLQEDKPGANSNETVIAKIAMFKDRAIEMFRREMSYPKATIESARSISDGSSMHTDENLVLTVYGNAPQPKHLFSSLPRSANLDKPSRQLQEIPLPNGLNSTRVIASGAPKPLRIPTLGELFPSPRNLPPLQPSKAPKNTTKGNVLTFYHPELTEKSKYRAGSYFSQNISTGQWLDYSNATPTTQIKEKRRERAQSLAGHKPSTTELEMSEIESLFRGAFSSFAPSKDDSAAMVPAGQLGRMWWHQVGQRQFQKMVDAEAPQDDEAEVEYLPDADEVKVDEEAIEKALENWDDSLIDPSLLDDSMGKKSDEDKEVDELLQDVSDLIETLASYQRNRNLAVPTSQDRHSTEPVNDMLRQGQHIQQPTEEEVLTYEALKAQLCLIVGTLPPYAAARVNSDKLAELNVSTKIEVRMDEQYGIMEDHEPVGRRPQVAAAAPQPAAARPIHRTPSVSAASPYGGHYGPGQQYNTPSRQPPIANGQHLYRPQPQQMHVRPPVPQSPVAHHTPPRAQPQPPYRPNGYPGYPQQPGARPPMPYPNNMPYQGTPTQPRMPQPNFPQAQPGTPQARYPPNFPAGYPQHGQPGMSPQPHQQAHHPPPQGYPQANGTAHMAPRPMPGQPHHGQPHPYGMSPQQQQMQLQQQQAHQQQQHAAQLQHQHGRPSPVNHPQQLMPHSPQHPYANPPPGASANQKLFGYQTYLDPTAQQRIIERAQHEARNNNQHLARANAQDMSRNFTGQLSAQPSPHSASIGQNAGLSSLGLGSPNLDMAKLAAQRASMSSGAGQMSPSPRPHSLAPNTPSPSINGMQQQQAMQPPPMSQSISPVPGAPQHQPPS